MKPYVLVAPLLAAILAGCDGGLARAAALAADPPPGALVPLPPATDPAGGSAEEPAPAPPFSAAVTNPYFPLVPGTVLVYEGDDEGMHRYDEVRVLHEELAIAGTPCTAVFQQVFLDGELAEVTTEWYAQDEAGNVWKFGEETVEFDGQRFVLAADSWVAGEGGAQPWLMLSADPQPGEVFVGFTPEGADELHVLSVNASVTVPAGTFDNCLQMVENPDDEEDADIILFAPGVGLASEQSTSGQIQLTEIRRE